MRRALYRAAARARARANPATLRRALELRSLTGDGPLVGVPPVKRLLVIAPHPDDESIACGGLIASLVEAGGAVTIIVATDGEATIGATSGAAAVAATRRAEASEAARELGVADVLFAGLPDGSLAAHAAALAAAIDEVAVRARPDALATTWFFDDHPDHRAVTAALGLCSLDRATPVWGGEVWTPVPANRVVPLSADAWQAKQAAVQRHATAMGAFDVTAMLGLSRYRSVHGMSGVGHAEAFLTLPLGSWLEQAGSDVATEPLR